MSFSLKMIAWAFVWLSIVLALLLLLANFGFAIGMISVAVGSFPDRFWLAGSIVAVILVSMQIYGLLPTGALQRSIGETLVTSLTTPPVRETQIWLAQHASEFSELLLYSSGIIDLRKTSIRKILRNRGDNNALKAALARSNEVTADGFAILSAPTVSTSPRFGQSVGW